MGPVILVPWRGGEASRDRYWELVREHLESLGFPLFTGDSRGPWARAAACNAAAASAGAWDIALIADADTVLEPEAVARAIERVEESRGAARPHSHRWMLNSANSKLVMWRGLEHLRPGRFRAGDAPGGGALVIHREAWDEIGGYDEAFVGWGYEDSAMNIRLATERRWERMPGHSYHLWHSLPNTRSASAQANRRLLDELRAARARELSRASRRAGMDLNAVL